MAEKRVDDEVVEKMEKKEEGEEEPLIRAKEKPLEEVLPEPETTVKAEEATSTVQDCLSSTQVKTEAVDEDPLVIGTADQTDEAVVAPEAKLTNEQVVVPATMDQTESGPLLQTSHPASAPDRATQVELTQQDAAAASTEPSTAVQPTVQQSTEAEAPTTAPTSNDDSAQANAPKDRPIASALSDSS
ncbi:hypothetical protein [Sporisorium scitamineum]|nr:hypothetical protein [Sporisorium scitamineum]